MLATRLVLALAVVVAAALIPATHASAQYRLAQEAVDWSGVPAGPLGVEDGLAISGDGQRLLFRDVVFRRTATGWVYEARLPRPSSIDDGGDFAACVALTYDGTRALVGAPNARIDYVDETTTDGAVAVYARAGTSWTFEALLTETPTPAALTPESRFGAALAIDRDGTRVLVGAPYAGRAHLLGRSGTTWTIASTIMRDASDPSLFGISVALSGDGAHALVGAVGGGRAGRARTFRLSGASWVAEASFDGSSTVDQLAAWASMSGDGTRAIVASGAGLSLLTRSGTTWTHEWTRSTPIAGPPSISEDGGTAVWSAPAGSETRAAWYGYLVESGGETGFAHVGSINLGDYPPLSPVEDRTGAVASGDGTRLVYAGTSPSLRVFHEDRQLGEGCRRASDCASGFCTDGVCCESACGGRDDDCEYCNAFGTCSIYTFAAECRPSTGPCDPREVCSGAAECPPDVLAPVGTTCRAAAGACDVAEACSGTSASCPEDELVGAGVVCRASAGACDVPEVCTGSSAACGEDVHRADGSSCGDADRCDGAERCESGSCVAGEPVLCDDGDPCTSETCDDASGTCASAPIATCCTTDLDCDDGDPCTTDRCSGAGGTCSHGEACVDGGSAPDAGGSRRDAGGGARDAGTPGDASRDASVSEAGPTDGGASPATGGGCDCRAAHPPRSARGPALIVLLALALAHRRGRRAIARTSSRPEDASARGGGRLRVHAVRAERRVSAMPTRRAP